jgi:tetratricopeptide (TPR) repeat protein
MAGSSAGEDLELEWWHEPEEESQEVGGAPPRSAQAFAQEDVSWVDDKHHPDYRHLDASFAEEEFEFTGADLELIIRENRFEPTREEDRILFGLRGVTLASGSSATGPSLQLRLTRPDHREFRCIIGVYDTSSKQIAGFIGSTVPWYAYVHDYALRGRGEPRTNMLPTGCYPYFVGPHGKHQIPGCFRLGTGHDKEQQERVAVLRTVSDVHYDTNDVFDPSIPHDNLHPSFSGRMFRSRGCQTVRGGYDAGHTGEWAQFRSAAGLGNRGDNGKRFDYVLVTGLEAAIASKLRRSGQVGNSNVVLERLTRLRHGSRGELVSGLQRKLGLTPTGAFGAQETKALATLQRKKFGFADGIYSPDMDTRLEFSILKSVPVATPLQVRHIAAGSKRIALVIGNGAYTAASQLGNPTRDADAIAEKLKALDFTVTLLRDATEHALVQAIVKFKDDLTACHVGLIFYAGHGVQIDGENYVLPVDCNPGTMPELRQSSVSLTTILEPLEESGKVGIIILDCCRDNPFRGRSLSRSLRRGFANLGAPAGTFIAFSTQPGATASDGDEGNHSPFAASLIQHISADDQDIGQMMRVVRKEVNEKTEGRQLPWDQSSLMVDFFAFRQTDRSIEQRVLTREELDRQRKETAKDREEEYWTLTSSSNSEQLLESFIAQYPDSRYRSEADEKLKEIRAKAERERARARRLKNVLTGSIAALVLFSCLTGFYLLQSQQLQRWQKGAYDGQFKLLMARARDRLGADDPDEARSQALAAHRILAEHGKDVPDDLRLDFTNILMESLKYDADVSLEGSTGTSAGQVDARFTPDGKRIVWTQDGPGRPFNIADAQTGRLLATQNRIANGVGTLITSPDGSHAALLSDRGDAELFALNSKLQRSNRYYDVYRINDMRAITFGGGKAQSLLAGVDKHGNLFGWRFDPKGEVLGARMALQRRATVKDQKNEFAISCYDDLCVWVEPEGTVAAAQLGTQPGGGWRPLRVTETIKGWGLSADMSSAKVVAPFIRLTEGLLFAYAKGELVVYDVSVKGDAVLLKHSNEWPVPALISLDIASDGTLSAQYAPDRTVSAWTVVHLQLKGNPGQRHFETSYSRDYDKQLVDFNLPTKSVVFAPQPGAGLDALKRRTESAGHPVYRCQPISCNLVNWLGASGQAVVGVNKNATDGIEPGGLVLLLQPGKIETPAKKLDLHSTLVKAFSVPENGPQDSSKSQVSQDREKKQGAPVLNHVAQAFDASRGEVLDLVVPHGAGGETNTDPYVAAFDVRSGKLSGDPVLVRERNPGDPPPEADFVLTGYYSDKLNSTNKRFNVLVSRGANGTLVAEHAPPEWMDIRAGGPAGLLRRDGNFLRVERSSRGKSQSPDLAGAASEIRLAPGRVSDFGFLDNGSRVFVAYAEGLIEIWDLDEKAAKDQPRSIVTRTKLISPRNVAWSLDQHVLYLHEGSIIKRFSPDGFLLDRYAPGRTIGAMVPLANGSLFAVVSTEHTVLPVVATSVDVEKLPFVAEALTTRFMARVDSEVFDNWFLPPAAKWYLPSFVANWLEPSGNGAADNGSTAACSGSDKTYAEECTLLRRYHTTPYQRTIAVAQHAYRTLEVHQPGRGAAFALLDAAEGKPLGLAVAARELGRIDRRLALPETPMRDINCAADRVAAMRKLFDKGLQSGHFIAPFFVGVELQCAGIAADRADMTAELRPLSERGDPMAFILLGNELERTARGNLDAIADAVENYGMAARLLLGQRDGLQRKEVFADHTLIESIEQEVNLRRVKLAERLKWPRLAEIFRNVETRFRKLQHQPAKDAAADVAKAYTVKEMLTTLDKADLRASLDKGEAVVADLIGQPMAEQLHKWMVRAHYEPVRRAIDSKAGPEAVRAAYVQFLRDVDRLDVNVHAKTILELDQALDEGARQVILPNDKLREVVADFANVVQISTAGRRLIGPKGIALYLELSDAATKASPKVATTLAIAALDKSEDLPKNKTNAAVVEKALGHLLQQLGTEDRYPREFAQVTWNYIGYATDRPSDMDPKDAARLVDKGLQLQQRFVDAHGRTPDRMQRLVAAYKAAGQLAFKDRDYNRAAAAYDKVIEFAPNDREGYMQRGTSYEFRRMYEPAIADYSEAIKLSPTWDAVYTYRGDSYRALGKYQQSIADYTKAIQIDPSDAAHYFGRGRTYIVSNGLVDAINDFSKAIDLRPRWDEAFRFRGITQIVKGDYDSAVADFTKALEIDPGDDNYYNGRAWAHFKAGRLDAALKDAEKAVSVTRFSPAESADTLGRILLAQGKTEAANAAFAKAQQRKPGLKLSPDETLKRLGPGLF